MQGVGLGWRRGWRRGEFLWRRHLPDTEVMILDVVDPASGHVGRQPRDGRDLRRGRLRGRVGVVVDGVVDVEEEVGERPAPALPEAHADQVALRVGGAARQWLAQACLVEDLVHQGLGSRCRVQDLEFGISGLWCRV